MAQYYEQPIVESLTEREMEILRHIAEPLSDREIAQRLFLSLNTVKWYNKQIYGKLGVSGRRQAVAQAREKGWLADSGQPSRALSAQPRHNLPTPLTSFVGREREVTQVKGILQDTRLLTLTGPGGTGKTRLALQSAAELAVDFEGDVFFVDLAPVSQPERILDTIAEVLGITSYAGHTLSSQLKTYLSNKPLLLLLDNFEHLLEGAPLIGDLLSAAPRLTVLVTSREILKLYGEHEYPVPPLNLPDMNNLTALSSLTEYEAVTLFIQRTKAVRPDVHFGEDDLRAAAETCIRLDGLPLAIELAAARMKHFSPRALLGQLESRFNLLKDGPRNLPQRQQTLRGAIDWSYDHLKDDEKTLFTRLSIFQGGWGIEAAEAICYHDLSIDVLDGLASLLNKNLLRYTEGPDGEPRFTMLETIHVYGCERLQESGETIDMHRRHAKYFTALVERAEPYTRGGPEPFHWLQRLDTDHDNLRGAFEWSLSGGDLGLSRRMVGALSHFWLRRGYIIEGEQWATRVLEASGNAPAAERARLLFTAGLMAFLAYNPVHGKQMHQEALALYRDLGDRRNVGWVLAFLGIQSLGQPDEYEEAVALVEESLAILQEVHDKAGIAQALNSLGELARVHGDCVRAKEYYHECLAIALEIGDTYREWSTYDNLGYIALQENDAEGAKEWFQRFLPLAFKLEDMGAIATGIHALSGASAALGQPERAARLIGAAEALYEKHGIGVQPADLLEYERFEADVRDQLDESAFNTARAEGQAMSLDKAIAYAMGEDAGNTSGNDRG